MKDINDAQLFQKITLAHQSLHQYFQDHEKIEKTMLEKETPLEMHVSTRYSKSIHLLLKTQLLILKGYPDELVDYRYPSYAYLLSCLQAPSVDNDSFHREEILDSCLLNQERCELVRTCVDLIFNTCLVSPLNAEELVRENGLSILESILNFYIKALSIFKNDSTEEKNEESQKVHVVTEIVVILVHTLSGVAYFESGRLAILALKDPKRLCLNWRKCIDLRFLRCNSLGCNMIKRYALEGIASMSRNEQLQQLLVGCHITWPILSSMLAYNPILNTSSSLSETTLESTISRDEQNFQAYLATRALGMLCGVMQQDDLSTTNNGILCTGMKQILTQPLARMLSNSQSEELLQTLNLNVTSALRLWDQTMRSELESFVKDMENRTEGEEYQDAKDALAACSSFEYSNLSDEVNIGGVYLRIFNMMDVKEVMRDLPNGSHFARSLIEFIGRCVRNSLDTEEAERSAKDERHFTMEEDTVWFHISDNRFLMAVRSVLHLVKLDGIIDDVICEKNVIRILFALLDLPRHNEVRLCSKY